MDSIFVLVMSSPSLSKVVVFVLLATRLRARCGHGIGSSARFATARVLIRAEVLALWRGRDCGATMRCDGQARLVGSPSCPSRSRARHRLSQGRPYRGRRRDLTARRIAALTLGLCVLMAVATLILLGIGPGRVLPSDIFSGLGGVSFVILALTFASVGAIVASRVPENRIGWIFLLTGLANSVQLFSWQYADVGLHAIHRLPGARGVVVFNTVIGEATAGLLGLSLLLFPDGRLPSRRWRPALACLVVGMVFFVLAGTLRPGRYAEPFAEVSNPLGLPGARGVMNAVDLAGWLLGGRRRRARRGGDDRAPAACAWPRASAAQACACGGLDRRGRGRAWSSRPGSSGRRDICRPGLP